MSARSQVVFNRARRGHMAALALSFLVAACAAPGSEPASSDAAQFEGGSDRAPSAATLQSVARIMAAQGKHEQCELVLLRMVHDFPRHASAYNELSELYLRQERMESAVAILRAGLEHAPEDAVLLNNLGMCHLMQDNYEAALTQFTAAAAIDPADVRARNNMAVALGLLGRMDEALALYQQSMSDAAAHYNLGVLWQMRGDEAQATAEFALAESL